MSGKVKLTREQAEAIETKKGTTGSAAVAKHLEGWTWPENKCLNDLSMEQFVKALYIGYEVEETFEAGDWVVYDNGPKYGYKTNQIKGIDERFVYFHGKGAMPLSTLRHATPEEISEEKQRRWWAKHGRGVKELKKGDIIKTVNGKMIEINHAEQLPNRFKIICFVEDRKDV